MEKTLADLELFPAPGNKQHDLGVSETPRKTVLMSFHFYSTVTEKCSDVPDHEMVSNIGHFHGCCNTFTQKKASENQRCINQKVHIQQLNQIKDYTFISPR